MLHQGERMGILMPPYRRREDLEDMLVDPAYFQAVFHTLTTVKELYRAQAELGLANESIASEWAISFTDVAIHESTEQNLSVQDEVYRLRSETKDAFDEAKALEARWAELEREQKEVFQVCSHLHV